MNKTNATLFLKFLLTFLAANLTVGLIDRNPWGWILILAIIGTILNFLIGDLFILRNTGNVFAAFMDGLLAGLTAFILDLSSRNFNTSIEGLIGFGFVITIAEYFFHRYLKNGRKVIPPG